MPIYEYRCQACGRELEKLQRMSDAPLRDCPDCGKPELKRLVSAAGFRLKGGGWYETDFKQGSKRNLADSGEKAPDKDKTASKDKQDGKGKSGGDAKSSPSQPKPAADKPSA